MIKCDAYLLYNKVKYKLEAVFVQARLISPHNPSIWVSQWLLFNANSAIFQLYHDENKSIFNEMMMGSAFY